MLDRLSAAALRRLSDPDGEGLTAALQPHGAIAADRADVTDLRLDTVAESVSPL